MRQQLRGVRILGASVIATLGLAAVLLIAPATAFAAYAPWLAQTSGTTQTLNGVAFVDADSGWAVGGGGTVRHTSNGGAKWTAQTSGTTQTLNGIAFVDADHGWIVGGGGTILRTTNGGASWSAQKSGTTQALNGVAFADAANGWAVGNRGTILHTTNGGAQWTAQTSGTRWTLYGVACANGDTCWAVGAKGTVRRSVDAGATWAGQAAGTKATLYAVAFVDSSNGWLAGSGGTLRTTTTGGGTWTARSAGGGSTLYALTRPDASRGWVAGASGAIRVTADGSGWSVQASGTTQTLRGLAARGARAWAVGGGGAILTYSPDLRAPATTAVGLQADDHSGWSNTSQTVTLTAADTGRSGVAATYFTVDGGAQTPYAAPFAISSQGNHRVTYWSVDQAGNAETASAGYVNIDTTPPSVGHDADAAWHATDVTVHLTAGDAGGSGVAATEYRPAGTPEWLPASGDAFVVAAAVGDGPRTYEIRAVDGAGNASPTGSCTVKIDATAPTTTPTGLGDEFSGWTDSATTVSLSTDDGVGSGVASIHYAVNGGAPQTYAHPFIDLQSRRERGDVLVGGQGRQPGAGAPRLRQHRRLLRQGGGACVRPGLRVAQRALGRDAHCRRYAALDALLQDRRRRMAAGPGEPSDPGLPCRRSPPRRLLRQERRRHERPADRLRQHRRRQAGDRAGDACADALGAPRRQAHLQRDRQRRGHRGDLLQGQRRHAGGRG